MPKIERPKSGETENTLKGELNNAPKGFYIAEQEKIEKARKDTRYESDQGFHAGVDTKALINEVIYMSSLETDISDENIKKLVDSINKFETDHGFKTNGIVVRLEDMIEIKNKSERNEKAKELFLYLSGVNEGIDVVFGERSNREEKQE